MMKYIAARAGVNHHTVRWMPDDVAAAWHGWANPPELVQLLVGIGFPWDRAGRLFQSIASPSPQLSEQVNRELAWDTPESAYNACCCICDYLPADMVVAALQQEFPLHEVAEKMVGFLEACL